MDEQQKRLLIVYLKRYYPNTYRQLLTEHPLTGPEGLRRVMGEKSIEYFSRAYLSDQFNREFGDYAVEIFDTLKQRIESKAQEKQAVVAPREHGKSTIGSCAIPTWAAVYQKKRFILFISANADTSANFLAKIKKALESPAIVEDFGKLKGDIWNADEINLSTSVWVACTGWKSGLRGMNKDVRPDLIILDDLEDKSVIESEALRKKLDMAFKDEIGRLGYYKTDFFYIGTLLAEDSLLSSVIKDPSWRTLFYQCVKSFPEREDLWDAWRKIYRDISNDNRFDDAYQFYLENKEEMLRGAEVLWSGRYPEDELKYKGAYYNIMINRETWGESSFFQEDQNEPRKSGDMIFTNLSYWNEFPDRLPMVMAVDPSEGKNDFASFSIGAKYKDGCLLREGHILKIDHSKMIDFIISKIREFPNIVEIVIEENLFKQMGTDLLKQRLMRLGLARRIIGVKNTKNKHLRIMVMEPYINGGRILFNKNSVAYNKQIEDYHYKAKHDDAPDSLEMLLNRLQIIKNRRPTKKPKHW